MFLKIDLFHFHKFQNEPNIGEISFGNQYCWNNTCGIPFEKLPKNIEDMEQKLR